MQIDVRRQDSFLDVLVRERDGPPDIPVAVQAIIEALEREGLNRILIAVSASDPIFRVEEYRLPEAFARLAGVPGLRVALVSDTRELFASHEYIELVARQRGLECEAFRSRAEALRWLAGDAPHGASTPDPGLVRLLQSEEGNDERIDPRRDDELERWSRKLGVSKDELRRAAEQAGPRIGDIRQHLVGGFTSAGPTS